MSTVCLFVAGALAASLADPAFTIAWTHSVAKTRWVESYVVEGRSLVLVDSTLPAYSTQRRKTVAGFRSLVWLAVRTAGLRPWFIRRGLERSVHDPTTVTDEMVDTFAVVGAWAELPSLLHARYDGLLDRITLYAPYEPGADDDHWAALCAAFHAGHRSTPSPHRPSPHASGGMP